MATMLTMPALSPTMEVGAIANWNKKEGDFIDVGEVLAEVETDKAVMDYEMVDEGYVAKFLVEPGVETAVGMPIAILAESMDEDISALLQQAASAVAPSATAPEAAPAESEPPAETVPPPAAEAPAPASAESAPLAAMPTLAPPSPPVAPPPRAAPQATPPGGNGEVPVRSNGGRVKISPYGKKLAEENQLDWRALVGTGPGGRIIAKDVQGVLSGSVPRPPAPAAAPGGAAMPAVPRGSMPEVSFEDQPLTMMRKAVAKKMEESKQTVPHFQARRKVRVDRLASERVRLNQEFPGESKISVNDLIVKACGAALRQHPTVNSQYLGDRIRRFHTVDISVAVGTDDGLITPIVRNVDLKGLREISAEVRELAGRAREKKLAPEEYTGGTFTVSNLGMYGITEFNGIINTPQACLLAVSGMVREPVVEDDQLVVGTTMNITLSSDHRIVDGLAAAQFLDTLTKLLENPVAMLL